jgi:CubicO group peptidase (beta-lactamase class C family)
MSQHMLSDIVAETARAFAIPGVAVGLWADGKEAHAFNGVTSVDNPLPINEDTLYLVDSITKTFTATALMRLAAEGRVELEAPVGRYVPEFKLADERAAAEITVLRLLNHTAGLDWGSFIDTGEGDDALALFVARLSGLKQVSPPGARASYSQAGYNLLGRVIETATGLTFERAVASLLFEPLGLSHSFFSRDDVMTRRFAVGHHCNEDGALSVARLWRRSRCDNPGGGIASSVVDQLRWARFHLGDGCSESGTRILPSEMLQRMQEPTVALRGSNLGDAIGICWFVRDVDGVRAVWHGGSGSGQISELLIVPERDFAIVSLSNAGPNGTPFNQTVVRWALRAYLGLTDRDPEPLPYDESRARELVGVYDVDMLTLIISTDGTSLTLELRIKPEIRASADKKLTPDYPPAGIALLPGDGDEYVVTEGSLKGQRGVFTRDESGVVVGVDLGAELFNRAPTASE